MWKWVVGLAAALMAAVAAILAVVRSKTTSKTLADQAVSLAKRDLARTRAEATKQIEAEVNEARRQFVLRQQAALEAIRRGDDCDLADAFNRLRKSPDTKPGDN